MREKYSISRNTLKNDQFFFNKYDKIENFNFLKINPGKPYYNIIAYCGWPFFYHNCTKYVGFINLKRKNGKLNFRFSTHKDYDGRGESHINDCEIDFQQKRIKLTDWFSSIGGLQQLDKMIDFVVENQKNELSAEEIKELKLISNSLKKEIIFSLKRRPKVFSKFKTSELQISDNTKHAETTIIARGRNFKMSLPKFKNLKEGIEYIKLKEKEGKIDNTIVILKELDLEKRITKDFLNLKNVTIKVKNPEPEYSNYITEINVKKDGHLEEEMKNEITDKYVTVVKVIGKKKISVTSNFEYTYNKIKHEKLIKNAKITTNKILEKTLNLIENKNENKSKRAL